MRAAAQQTADSLLLQFQRQGWCGGATCVGECHFLEKHPKIKMEMSNLILSEIYNYIHTCVYIYMYTYVSYNAYLFLLWAGHCRCRVCFLSCFLEMCKEMNQPIPLIENPCSSLVLRNMPDFLSGLERSPIFYNVI